MEEDTATMSSAEIPVGNLSRRQVADETVKASMADNDITASTVTTPSSSTTTITQGTTTIIGLEQLEANHEKNQRPSRQSSRARSSRRSRSGRSRSRSRSGRSVSSTNSTSSPGHRVVYSTAAKYDKWVVLILSVPLVLILFQMMVHFIATKIADFERSSEVWIMGWTFIFILGLYMAVLPKQVDIRSNGTIGIKTFLATYQFDDICHAYLAGLGPEPHSSWIMLGGGRRLRFATCVDPANQVVIRRRGGTDKWDLVVSPQNPDEFLRMMQSLITKLEIQKGTSNNSNNNNTTTTTTPNTEMSLNGDTTVNSGESSSAENNNVIATMV